MKNWCLGVHHTKKKGIVYEKQQRNKKKIDASNFVWVNAANFVVLVRTEWQIAL